MKGETKISMTREVNKRISVYVGVSDCGTKKMIKNIQYIEKRGADTIGGINF